MYALHISSIGDRENIFINYHMRYADSSIVCAEILTNN